MSSDDELFKLLEASKHIPGNDTEKFINDLNLQASTKCTQTMVIFWVYLKWCIKNNVEPTSRNVFFKQFKTFFKQASRDRVRRYYVTSTHFILHPSEVEAAKSEARQERRWHAVRRVGKARSKRENQTKEYWKLALAKRWANRNRKSET